LIVGAPSQTLALEGDAYIYTRSGSSWSEPLRLGPDDGAAFIRFGFSVAISGDVAIVGALHGDGANPGAGAVYVFTRSGSSWPQSAKLYATDETYGQFGWSVAISGSTVLVGSPTADSSAGAVYAFTNTGSGWNEQKLVASDALPGDEFGYSVAVDGGLAVVGARGAPGRNNPQGSGQGKAYVFVDSSTGWVEHGTGLFAGDAADEDLFGTSAAVSGTTVMVGAPNADTVYAFAPLVSATQEHAIGGRGEREFFGGAVALDDDVALVGSHLGQNGAWVAELLLPDGSTCSSNTECRAGQCVSGICCNQACGGECETCASGTCTALPGSAGSPTCSPYLCSDSGGACPTSCTAHDDCIDTHYCSDERCVEKVPNGEDCPHPDACISGRCVEGTCGGRVEDGTRCSNAFDCRSGHCVDGVCCDDTCRGQCEACDLDDARGTCSPVVGAPRGERDACAGADTDCGGECDGEERARCIYPNGADCGSRCEDGEQTDSVCDGEGSCVDGDARSCGDFVCEDEVSCRTSCESDADCATGRTCRTDGLCETGAECLDEDTSRGVNGREECAPYLCDTAGSGTCKTTCESIEDCTPGNICDREHECAAPRESATTTESGGCGSCRASGGRSASGGWHLVALALGASLFGRRRRHARP
jgi:hypothetical protein